jgi:hypothetical protein
MIIAAELCIHAVDQVLRASRDITVPIHMLVVDDYYRAVQACCTSGLAGTQALLWVVATWLLVVNKMPLPYITAHSTVVAELGTRRPIGMFGMRTSLFFFLMFLIPSSLEPPHR